jgi:hypothetical protein
MIRLLATVAASATLPAAAGASAQAAGYYVATPVAAPAKARLMTRSTPWRVQNGAYVAAEAPERAITLCQLVARDAGPLASFSAGGKPFDAATLDKCNAKAPAAKTVAAAEATPAGS